MCGVWGQAPSRATDAAGEARSPGGSRSCLTSPGHPLPGTVARNQERAISASARGSKTVTAQLLVLPRRDRSGSRRSWRYRSRRRGGEYFRGRARSVSVQGPESLGRRTSAFWARGVGPIRERSGGERVGAELPRFGPGGWARSANVREGGLGGEYRALAPAEASDDPTDPIDAIGPALAGEIASRGTIQSPNIRR
jgi:hypothetical protein